MDWIQVVQQFGVMVALVLFFVYQSKIREDRLAARIASLEDYYRDTLSTVVKENTAVMIRLEKWLERQQQKNP